MIIFYNLSRNIYKFYLVLEINNTILNYNNIVYKKKLCQ